MRFYHQPHRFYCGVDLHARTMYLCVLDQGGAILLHKEVPAEPVAFLEAIAPLIARAHGDPAQAGGQTSDDDLLDHCWLPVRRAKSTN